ncbi:MAG: FIG01122063: hypothetical protein, partial [uncultured Nocardioidaceae bacterium]
DDAGPGGVRGRGALLRQGVYGACGVGAGLEQPEAAHPGPPQAVAGLRGAPGVTRCVPERPRLPPRHPPAHPL